MLRPLFYLGISCLFSKTEALFHAPYLLQTLFDMAPYLALLKLSIPILTLLNRPAWYDEDAPENHCHFQDTEERLAVEHRRVQEELAILGNRFRAGVREPLFLE